MKSDPKTTLRLSPKSSQIFLQDKSGNLWYSDIADKTRVLVSVWQGGAWGSAVTYAAGVCIGRLADSNPAQDQQVRILHKHWVLAIGF